MASWEPKSVSRLKLIINKFELCDIWRKKFPNCKQFTWSNKDVSRHSRIDFWLTPNSLEEEKVDIKILTTPLTDHRAISFKADFLPGESEAIHSGYWKMNSSLLNHYCVKTEIERLIQMYWNKAQKESIYSSNWELLKHEISKYMRRYGSLYAKSRRLLEEQVISEITSLSSLPPGSLSEEENLKLYDLQNKLDDINKAKAEGAFIRSRQKWLEQEEQMTAYFFRLEKTRAKFNSILQLNIEGRVTNNKKEISKYC